MMRYVWSMSAALLLAGHALAGPQHWGFGFGYLVTVEEDATGLRALCVYEPPMRVKEGEWLLRWRDTSAHYTHVVPGGLAVGDFWPQGMGGKEYLVLISHTADTGFSIQVLDPPEVFSTRAWRVLNTWPSQLRTGQAAQTGWPGRTSPLRHLEGKAVVASAAGDILGVGRDQLVVLAVSWDPTPHYSLGVYVAPETPTSGDWTLHAVLAVANVPGDRSKVVTQMAVGDFWGHGRDLVMLQIGDQRVYCRVTDSGHTSADDSDMPQFIIAHAEVVADAPVAAGVAAPLTVVASDFLKDGFAYLAEVATERAAETALRFHVAPRIAERYNTCWIRPDETFAGARLDGQALGDSRLVMRGTRGTPYGAVVAAGAGRLFGYITTSVDERKEKLWKPWQYQGFDDVEIAFAKRTPVHRLGVPKEFQDGNWPWEPDDHYGWPHRGETVTYEIHVKNNSSRVIPAGEVTLRAWVDTPHRNADTRPDAHATQNFSFTINEAIPPFDPAKPEYTVVRIPLEWPFDLVQPEGWTWKKINVREIGERWLVVRLDYATDQNERNDRYDLALNSLLFRPVLRFDVDAPPHPAEDGLEGRPDRKINTLAYRQPIVQGDPESKEYYGRKLADAVQCMWERSRTSTGEDVWQRVAFDSYRLYDTHGREGLKGLNRADDWSWYEAPRENEHWLGLWGDYERFDPRDGGAELHETGHLVHRIGDLYHYFINPINLRSIRMADGTPVQMNTYAWGLDSFCSGHAIIGEPTADLHRYLEGARYGLGFAWHRMLPERIAVRVLDRDGQPVADTPIAMWMYPQGTRHQEGRTAADGTWDPQVNKGRNDVFTPFNLPQYSGRVLDALAHVFVVDFPGYSEFMIWGAEDIAAHSRYTLMHQTILNRAEWTWDFHTLYKAGAPQPAFEIVAAVQGRQFTMQISGPPQAEYRIYRRWEPTYRFEHIADLQAPSGAATVSFMDDMGAADWYMAGRYRAAYYVTQRTAAGESLPRRIYGIAVENARGVADAGSGKLLVSLNCGKAEPFGVLFDGTTPAEEYVKHFRFGHTAARIVPSRLDPQKLYATLVNSDTGWQSRLFDVIRFDQPDRHQSLYAVLDATADVEVESFSTAEPYTVTLRRHDPEERNPICPGDWARAGDRRARIRAVDGLTLTLDQPLFEGERERQRRFVVEFGGGTPGSDAHLRELRAPRGLDLLLVEGAEYPAIADTGNRRIVVWDSGTRFVAQWAPDDGEFRPTAIATDPRDPSCCFVLDRQRNGRSRLYHLQFDGTALTASENFPIEINVSDATAQGEMGLAAAVDTTGRPLFAITDATRGLVLEVVVHDPRQRGVDGTAEQFEVVNTYSAAIGAFVGPEKLTRPSDVAYSTVNGELRLFAVDGQNRVVRLR